MKGAQLSITAMDPKTENYVLSSSRAASKPNHHLDYVDLQKLPILEVRLDRHEPQYACEN